MYGTYLWADVWPAFDEPRPPRLIDACHRHDKGRGRSSRSSAILPFSHSHSHTPGGGGLSEVEIEVKPCSEGGGRCSRSFVVGIVSGPPAMKKRSTQTTFNLPIPTRRTRIKKKLLYGSSRDKNQEERNNSRRLTTGFVGFGSLSHLYYMAHLKSVGRASS